MPKKIKPELVEQLATALSTTSENFTFEGENGTGKRYAHRLDRDIVKLTISCKDPAAAQISIDAQVDGVTILTTPALIEAGKREARNVSLIANPSWPAFTDLSLVFPNTSGNTITADVETETDGVEQAYPVASGISKIGNNVWTNNTTTDPDSTTLEYTQVAGSDRGMFVLVCGEGTMPAGDCTATYGGQSMTRIPVDVQVNSFVLGFYLEEANLPANGANNIVLSHPNFVGSSIYLYAGQLSGCQYDTADTNANGSLLALSNTVTPSFDGSYVISLFTTGSSSASAISENNGQFQLREELQNGHKISVAERVDTPAAPITLTSSYDDPAHHLARIAMVFNPKQ